MSPYAERFHRTFSKTVAYGALACFAAGSGPGLAALTDISNVPLASTVSAQVKPNIMFVLDDSGSMGWTHMPDSVETDALRVGYKNYRCNTVYYNPAVTYAAPKNADGTSFANSSFTAARINGYSGTSTTDLSASGAGPGAEPAAKHASAPYATVLLKVLWNLSAYGLMVDPFST